MIRRALLAALAFLTALPAFADTLQADVMPEVELQKALLTLQSQLFIMH